MLHLDAAFFFAFVFFFFLKKRKNHKNTIKATHCDSIIAVVVILGFVCLHLFFLYKKQQLFNKTFKAFLIGKQCNN